MNFLHWVQKRNKNFTDSFITSINYRNLNAGTILLFQFVTKWIQSQKEYASILDAGAGRSAYVSILKSSTNKYVSTDIEYTPLLDSVGSVERLPFKENSFDLIFCSQVLEHVPHPWRAIKEFKRVVKPGGTICITVPFLGYIHNAPHDYFRFSHYALKQLIKDSGLELKEITSLGGFFCFLGYIRSTILMPLFGLPIIGKILFKLNYYLSKLDILLDNLTKSHKVLTLNYVCIAQKPQ